MNESFDEASARVRAIFGNEVSVKPVREQAASSDSENEEVDLLTRVCYFYPQYTLEDAKQLASTQVEALLWQAEKQRATEMYHMTLIAAAPYSKKGKMVKELLKKYEEIIKS